MICAICNEEIKGKGVKLGGGQTICKDCDEYSAMVSGCDDCEKVFLVTDLVRDPDAGIYCWDCIREVVVEQLDYMTWEDWLEVCEEEGAKATVEGYLAWHLEEDTVWIDCPKNNPHRRMLDKMLAEEIKKAA